MKDGSPHLNPRLRCGGPAGTQLSCQGCLQGCVDAATKPGAGESLNERYPIVAAEWHPALNGELTPADVKPGSNLKVWWRCSACAHEWQAAINNRTTRASRCPECSKRLVRECRTTPGWVSRSLRLTRVLAGRVASEKTDRLRHAT